jgi:hypothetical protein
MEMPLDPDVAGTDPTDAVLTPDGHEHTITYLPRICVCWMRMQKMPIGKTPRALSRIWIQAANPRLRLAGVRHSP